MSPLVRAKPFVFRNGWWMLSSTFVVVGFLAIYASTVYAACDAENPCEDPDEKCCNGSCIDRDKHCCWVDGNYSHQCLASSPGCCGQGCRSSTNTGCCPGKTSSGSDNHPYNPSTELCCSNITCNKNTERCCIDENGNGHCYDKDTECCNCGKIESGCACGHGQ